MSTQTPVTAPFPDGDDLSLRLNLGACRLSVSAGGEQPWVDGTYTHATDDSPLRVDVDGSRLTISQDRTFAGSVGLLRGLPTCELRLGTGKPFRLQVVTGASDVDLDLGGVPLRGLEIKAGAGRIDLVVGTPNPVDADEVSVRMGAGALDATGLGNLAAERLRADSGAAAVSLDLTGELRRHLDARVSAGMSSVRITLPADRPARVSAEATLGGSDLGDGFRTQGGAVFTMPEGDPVITLNATVALGGLQLRTAS